MLAASPLLSLRQAQHMLLSPPPLDLINDLRCSGMPKSERRVGRDELFDVLHPVRIGPSHDGSDVVEIVPVDEVSSVRPYEIRHFRPRSPLSFSHKTSGCDMLSTKNSYYINSLARSASQDIPHGARGQSRVEHSAPTHSRRAG